MENITNYEALEVWYLDRITAGEGEEVGSVDSYEDETGFIWFITKTGGNTYDLTTEANPIPFAEGRTDENGQPTILYYN